MKQIQVTKHDQRGKVIAQAQVDTLAAAHAFLDGLNDDGTLKTAATPSQPLPTQQQQAQAIPAPAPSVVMNAQEGSERMEIKYHRGFTKAQEMRDRLRSTYPELRIVAYTRGYAIQSRPGGPYFDKHGKLVS